MRPSCSTIVVFAREIARSEADEPAALLFVFAVQPVRAKLRV
jgi:hypothetical protein